MKAMCFWLAALLFFHSLVVAEYQILFRMKEMCSYFTSNVNMALDAYRMAWWLCYICSIMIIDKFKKSRAIITQYHSSLQLCEFHFMQTLWFNFPCSAWKMGHLTICLLIVAWSKLLQYFQSWRGFLAFPATPEKEKIGKSYSGILRYLNMIQ